MANVNGGNASLLTKTSGAAIEKKTPAQTVADYLKRMAPEISKALPKHMDADRLARVALTTIRTTPKLLECRIESLMASVMQSAQLGLEPGLLGHCYIIPFGREAQFIIGYRGMIDLARRSGNIESITVEPVYKNDYFKFKRCLNQDEFEHIPWDMREDQEFSEPGELIRVYLIARFKNGGYYFHRMSKAQIDDHRKRSKSGNNGPWVTDYEEMAKKTVVRSAWKWLPISVDIARQVSAADETVKQEISDDMSDVIDISSQVQPEPEPGITVETVNVEDGGVLEVAESMKEKHERMTRILHREEDQGDD